MNAIELYSQAYDLHYKNNDLSAARAIYREILQKYPDSQECTYAEVQLGLIDKELDKMPAAKPKTEISVMGVMGFIFSVLCVFGIIALFFTIYLINKKAVYYEYVIEGMQQLNSPFPDRGVQSLLLVTKSWPNRTLAQKVLVEHFLQKNDVASAEKILLKIRKVNPKDLYATQRIQDLAQLKIKAKQKAEAEARRKEAAKRREAVKQRKARRRWQERDMEDDLPEEDLPEGVNYF